MIYTSDLVRLSELAGMQYLGTGADSKACVEALRRVLVWSERPRSVKLLTAGHAHAFLLAFEHEIPVAIKDGFSSGYKGTGPSALADALALLQASNLWVDEVEVRQAVLKRLSASALTQADLEEIESAVPVRPMRWPDHVDAIYEGRRNEPSVWAKFEPVMPFALISPQLVDLALEFFSAPDRVLLDGFRRLEDRVRQRTGLAEHGAKLFSQAFAGDESRLTWRGPLKGRGSNPDHIDKGEQAGRAQLFIGAYQAFRNPRAHRTLDASAAEALSEFLLLNQLFRFEAEAIERSTSAQPPA